MFVATIQGVCFGGEPTPADYVRPLLGTDEHGHTYPGATVPFGLVQLSPDTRLKFWDGVSGYHYSDNTLLGFSHTHLTGTGCGDMGDIRFAPISGEIPKITKDGFPQRFSHDDEKAKPGYYRVVLQDSKIEVELTATPHAGFHKYVFPADAVARLFLDVDRGSLDKPVEGCIEVESKTRVSGFRRSTGRVKEHAFYYVAEFSRPFDSWAIEVDDQKTDNPPKGQGVHTQAFFNFNDASKPVLVKVGISPTSVEGARKNLEAEIPAWDFDGAVRDAEKNWNDVLGRLEIKTDDAAVREIFYTAFYHSCLAPTLYGDVDGGYFGLDHKAHVDKTFQNYSTFSLWDTYRAQHPLITIVQPQRIDDIVNSMLAHYREFDNHTLPVWSMLGNETWCMIGNHAIPVIADAYGKGFHGFDAEAVLKAMYDSVLPRKKPYKHYTERLLAEYDAQGYIYTQEDRYGSKQSVSRTLEYAYDDWCVGQMAGQLGKKDLADRFAKRAQNYRNHFDPETGFMRGKFADGKWRDPFAPNDIARADYTEATAWHYLFSVPHDVQGLIDLIGGDEKFVAKLDDMFSASSESTGHNINICGLIGQYAHGNEPCHHVPYLYNYAGTPWKSQERVRQIMTDLYANTPGGLCGNDDCGQLSAWYVFSAIGFYPVNPASGVYVIGSPLVDRVTIRLDPKYQKGGAFTIIAENNSTENKYIQSATWNGKPFNRSWFSHAELVAGGELTLKMGPKPNPDWAKRPEDRPPATCFGK
jgi:predicted alpha-1,2-mannosidase